MPLHLELHDIFWRLLSALLGASLIGLDRGEHGHVVGLRTTILVCLASCLAMLQANALLSLSGKSPDSFAVMDLMRLPLGILSGMGFIGGGAILRRENLVSGVTTAASLWFVTVIGLCFGGGQLLLGWIGIVLGLLTLNVFHKIEEHIPHHVTATLLIEMNSQSMAEKEIRAQLKENKMVIKSAKITTFPKEDKVRMEWKIRWTVKSQKTDVPNLIPSISLVAGVTLIEWTPPEQ